MKNQYMQYTSSVCLKMLKPLCKFLCIDLKQTEWLFFKAICCDALQIIYCLQAQTTYFINEMLDIIVVAPNSIFLTADAKHRETFFGLKFWQHYGLYLEDLWSEMHGARQSK